MKEKTEQKPLYDGFIAEYYDSTPIVLQRKQDVAFYVSQAKKYGEPVLELGCGTGRVAIVIAEAGLQIVGMDLSEKMLERAVEKRAKMHAEAKARLHLLQGDMTKFDLGGKFRTILIPFRPFQHLLKIEEQMACLQCVKEHLKPDGRLVLDVFQTDAERMHDARYQQEVFLTEYDLADGRHVKLSERVAGFHRAEQKNDVEMIFQVKHKDGREERLVMAWPLRYFFRYEVEHLLARCGFRVEAEYGNFDGSAIGDASPEMIFLAGVGG
jgi:SAM-dependent methyltransferase